MDLSRYPPMYKDLIDKGAEPVAKRLNVPLDAAREAVFILCEIMRKDWAGINQYLSKGCAYEIEKRDLEMYEKFDGNNYKALAKEFGITERQVYTRLDIIREEEFKRKQPSLFG
jgi:Mor family transcriptional regulator